MDADKQKVTFPEPTFDITDEEEIKKIIAHPIESKCLVFLKK